MTGLIRKLIDNGVLSVEYVLRQRCRNLIRDYLNQAKLSTPMHLLAPILPWSRVMGVVVF